MNLLGFDSLATPVWLYLGGEIALALLFAALVLALIAGSVRP